MSENYYEQLLNKLEKDFLEEKYDEAKTLIDEELKMPFVPKDVLEKLEKYQEQLSILNKKEKRQSQSRRFYGTGRKKTKPKGLKNTDC